MALGEYKEAISLYDSLINGDSDIDILPQVYYQKGIALYKMAKMSVSEDFFLDAIKKFKGRDSDISLNIFIFLYDSIVSKFSFELSLDELTILEKRFRFLIENFKEKRPLLTIMTRNLISLLVENKKYKEALFYLKNISDYFSNYKPTLAWAGIQEGDIYQKLNKYDEAEMVFKDVYNKYEEYSVYGAWALFKLGELYEADNNMNKAMRIYEKILEEYKGENEFYFKAENKISLLKNKADIKSL
jgi:tetratricopeptide (TPR) repeat protein